MTSTSSLSTSKRKHNILTVDKNLGIMSKLDKGETSVSLARFYTFGETKTTNIKKNRKGLMSFPYREVFQIFFQIRGLSKKYREFWISAGYVYSIFDFFVALCWYSCPSLMLTSSAILNVQLTFDSCFAWTSLARLRFLPIPKNGSKNLYQIFCEKQN